MVNKINRSIEIVGSANPRLNAMSVESQRSMLRVLTKHYMRVSITHVNNLGDLKALVTKKPDLVVLGMKVVLLEPRKGYDESAKVWLSDYLNEHEIVFTGSDTQALKNEYDKPIAKQIVLDAGLSSPRYFTSDSTNPQFDHNLTFPLFVKPSNRGDSTGIDEHSLVYSDSELQLKVLSIHSKYQSSALIEEYLPGQEFSVAVFRRSQTKDLFAMPIEIVTETDSSGNSFLSQSVKEADTEVTYPVTDQRVHETVTKHATGVFQALGARDYGRIDLRLNARGQPHFIEANLMPGLSTHGYLYRCLSFNREESYEKMILWIIDLAMERVKGPAISPFPDQFKTQKETSIVPILSP